jgi:tetratricopeptide (TPR) repeat protein
MFLGFSSQSQKKPGKYSDYDRGYYYYCYQKWDSAFLMFNRYVNNPDDTLEKGKAYNYMGEMQWYIGDLYGAQESLTGTIHTLNPLNKKHREDIGYAYNLLGNISLDLKLYDEAINFYNNAMIFLKGADYLLEIMNGKATAYQKKGSYYNAIALYDSILAQQPADQLLVARIIDNRARTKWLSDPGYPALPELQKALQIRVDSQYSLALNASYAHLSDYYAKSKPDSALWYARKMFDKANESKSPDDMLEAIDKMIRLNSSSTLKEYWYGQFKKLNDSLQLSRDTTRNRFALIRYDVQKSKADNLTLQQHITRQGILLYGLIALAVVIITGLSIWYNKRRKTIKQESEIAIRNSRLKTSQKVHDVVANGLYGIMNELEHGKTLEHEPLMTKIEELYEKSRNISYEEISSDNSAGYNSQVHDLLTSFANEQTKVIIVGNQQTFWNKINGSQKQELQLSLNEIMINMKKHSHAKNVIIHFKQELNTGVIHYKDDGVGFSSAFIFGNGLKNTVSRIKSLNGNINFGKSERGGVSITISFPQKSSET